MAANERGKAAAVKFKAIIQRSFALLRISARGSDAAQAPQLAEKIRTL
jgi:hypothetical protein